MTSVSADEPSVRSALLDHLRATGEINGELRLVGEPVASARSILYRYAPSQGGVSYMVKAPLPGDAPIDSNPPLDAAQQYRALTQAHEWFHEEDAHSVARPVALLEDLDALVLEFVHGPDLGEVLHRSLRDSATAIRAARAAGDFLRRFHAHTDAGTVEVDLGSLVDEVEQVRQEVLMPVGIEVPDPVRGYLSSVGRRTVRSRQVLLHGDFVPKNLILTGADELTMIDPSLVLTGPAEIDLARFLCVMSSDPAFVPGFLVPRVRHTRQHAEVAFREGYGLAVEGSAALELRLLTQLLKRWRRRRDLSGFAGHSQLLRARSLIIDRHMRSLVMESALRLQHFSGMFPA